MNAPAGQSQHCRVIGAERLPAASGGAAALCGAIERAAATRAPTVAYRAEVRILSRSRMTARVTANGAALPEQNFASMDRDLDAQSFDRFARAIADQLAKGAGAK